MTALQKFIKQIVLKQVKGSVYLVPAICDTQIDEVLESEGTPDISDCFSFAKYLNKHFEYSDNIKGGDIYIDKNGATYTELEIYDEWLNNR